MKREESLEVFVEVRRGEVHEVEGGGEVWEVLGKVAVAAVAAPEDEVRARDHLEAGSEQSVGRENVSKFGAESLRLPLKDWARS